MSGSAPAFLATRSRLTLRSKPAMWRALFMAVGLYGIILGVECLAVERVVLRKSSVRVAVEATFAPEASSGPNLREIVPPEWAPFSLMALGSVIVLYSFTVPRRARGK